MTAMDSAGLRKVSVPAATFLSRFERLFDQGVPMTLTETCRSFFDETDNRA